LLSQNDVGRNAARTCRHHRNIGIRYNPEFPVCFFNAGSLPPIAAAALLFFLHSFQSQRTGRARQAFPWDQKAMFAPFRSDLLDTSPFNSSVVQIAFVSVPCLSGLQRQTLHPPRHASQGAMLV
jgi:hypothetical protein